MQLTTHTDYALRLLIYLATSDAEQVGTIQDAARRFDISANHLAKVAQTLVQKKYLISQRGRGGGLRLARTAEDINIGEVVRHTENLNLLPCFGEDNACPIQPACKLKSILGRAQLAFLEVLDQYTLANLITNRDTLRQLIDNVA